MVVVFSFWVGLLLSMTQWLYRGSCNEIFHRSTLCFLVPCELEIANLYQGAESEHHACHWDAEMSQCGSGLRKLQISPETEEAHKKHLPL